MPGVDLSEKQIEIMRHALGVDKYGHKTGDRNYFCAGGENVITCAELVSMGLMRSFQRTWLPYYNVIVTDAGREVLRQYEEKQPVLTSGQRRYRRFLTHDSGLRFGEWLKYYGREVSDGR